MKQTIKRLIAMDGARPLSSLFMLSSFWLVVGTLAQLFAFVILARALGVSDFGQLMTITAATQIGTHLCGLGAGEGMVRRVARDRAAYPSMAGHNIILMASSGALLLIVFVPGIYLLFYVHDDKITAISIVLSLSISNIFLYRVVLYTEHVFIGHWRVGLANTVNVGFSLAKAVSAWVACDLYAVNSLADWSLWHLSIHLLGAFVCGAMLIPLGQPVWKIVRDEIPLGIHFSTPWFFMTFRNNVDLLVLGAVTSPATVGAYSVVKRVVEASLITSQSLNRLLYPGLSRAAEGGPARVVELIVSYMPAILGVSVGTAIGLYVVAPWLPLFVGGEFVSAVDGIRILCWSTVLAAVQAAAFDALGATEQHSRRAKAYNLGSIVGVLVIGLATYAYTVNGAFLSIYLSQAFLTLSLWRVLIVYRRQHNSPSSFFGGYSS